MMPQDAEVIAFGHQGGVPVFWARCNRGNPLVERKFLVLFTGVENEKLDLISTVHLGTINVLLEAAVYMVFHLFEVTE
jgi:hypothetical protein